MLYVVLVVSSILFVVANLIVFRAETDRQSNHVLPGDGNRTILSDAGDAPRGDPGATAHTRRHPLEELGPRSVLLPAAFVRGDLDRLHDRRLAGLEGRDGVLRDFAVSILSNRSKRGCPCPDVVLARTRSRPRP